MGDKTSSGRFPLLLSVLIGLVGCYGEKPTKDLTATLSVTPLGATSFVSSKYAHSLHWPQFLLAEGRDRFLWGAGSDLYRIEHETDPDVTVAADADFTKGLDRLIAAARTSQGTLALLDSAGTIAIRSPLAGKEWRFSTHLENQAVHLALTESRVYLLLQNDSEESSAIAAFTFSGTEAGRWGRMPAAGIVQTSLNGGGVAACPDGSIFYSYINSPQILRLENGPKNEVRALGKRSESFTLLAEDKVREAYRAGKLLGSVAPLVKLGLSASRVLSLLCSEEGLLLRQVAQPRGGGTHIEVWNSSSETLVGTIPAQDGILLDVRDQTLYLGTAKDDFKLERIRFRVDPQRPAKAARS